MRRPFSWFSRWRALAALLLAAAIAPIVHSQFLTCLRVRAEQDWYRAHLPRRNPKALTYDDILYLDTGMIILVRSTSPVNLVEAWSPGEQRRVRVPFRCVATSERGTYFLGVKTGFKPNEKYSLDVFSAHGHWIRVANYFLPTPSLHARALWRLIWESESSRQIEISRFARERPQRR
jgi:hypothetical protein